MALTANQKRLFAEALQEKFEQDPGGFIDWIVTTLLDATPAQVANRLRAFAARRRDAETQRLATYDANRQGIVDRIAWYDAEAQ